MLVAARLLSLDNRPADAVGHLSSYDQTRQDLLLGLLSLAAGLTEGDPHKISQRQATVFLDQLRGMAGHLQPLAPFTIGRLCFCRKIWEYGRFEEWPTDHVFRPGEMVLLYAEIQNFSTVQRGESYVINLASSMEIRNAKGQQVLFRVFEDDKKPDRSLSVRRDYCNKITLTLSTDYSPGTYTFHFIVKDLPTGRTAKRSLEFVVGPATGR